MCGIFGHVVGPDGTPNPNILTELAKANSSRGERGFGTWLWSREQLALVKSVDSLRLDLVEEAAKYSVSAFHVRAPTCAVEPMRGGDEIRRVHPFTTDRFLLAHNGIIQNWKAEKYEKWRLTAASGELHSIPVDSTVLLAGIQFYTERGLSTKESIAKTLSDVEGQMGCWMWDDGKWRQMLYLWRVMSTIYTRVIEGVMYFSSAKSDALPSAQLLQEGKIYVATPHTFPIRELVETFTYSSPYHT